MTSGQQNTLVQYVNTTLATQIDLTFMTRPTMELTYQDVGSVYSTSMGNDITTMITYSSDTGHVITVDNAGTHSPGQCSRVSALRHAWHAQRALLLQTARRTANGLLLRT